MAGDAPEPGKGLFGYRRAVVQQLISDRDIMLRQAEGRVRAAESRVAELEGELSGIRERSRRMQEQLERLRSLVEGGSGPPSTRPHYGFEGDSVDDWFRDGTSEAGAEVAAGVHLPPLDASIDPPSSESPDQTDSLLAPGLPVDDQAAEPGAPEEPLGYDTASDVAAAFHTEPGPEAHGYASSHAALDPSGFDQIAEAVEPGYRFESAYDVLEEGALDEPDAQAFRRDEAGDRSFADEGSVRQDVAATMDASLDTLEEEKEELVSQEMGGDTGADYGVGGAESPHTSDITARFLTEELAGILTAAEESAARIVERAQASTEQQIAEANRLWREVQGEIARFAAWRQEVEPIIEQVRAKIEEVREKVEAVPERIREALAPMADSISSVDADLAELAAAAPPPLLVSPAGLEGDAGWDAGEEAIDVTDGADDEAALLGDDLDSAPAGAAHPADGVSPEDETGSERE